MSEITKSFSRSHCFMIDVKIILHLLATKAVQGSGGSLGEYDLTTKFSYRRLQLNHRRFKKVSGTRVTAFQGKVLCRLNIT